MNSSRGSEKPAQRKGNPNPDLAGVVRQNISAIIAMREEKEREKTLQERIADMLTLFSGSMMFVYVHAVWFGVWVLINIGVGGLKPFDPFPFSLLTLIVSLEAIFLSTFVLISQNHAGQIADKRADLDLQINLLSEHEITRILRLTDAIAHHLGIEMEERSEHNELREDVDTRKLLDEIESREASGVRKGGAVHG